MSSETLECLFRVDSVGGGGLMISCFSCGSSQAKGLVTLHRVLVVIHILCHLLRNICLYDQNMSLIIKTSTRYEDIDSTQHYGLELKHVFTFIPTSNMKILNIMDLNLNLSVPWVVGDV